MNKQEVVEIIAQQIEEAKNILNSAGQLARDNGIEFNFVENVRELYEDVTEEYVDWYASSC
jgi:hypothetical protein